MPLPHASTATAAAAAASAAAVNDDVAAGRRTDDDVWEVALPSGATAPMPRRSVSWGGDDGARTHGGATELPADLAELLVRRGSNEAELEAENKALAQHIAQLRQTLEEVALAELTAELEELELREADLVDELAAARDAAAEERDVEAESEGASCAARIVDAALQSFERAGAGASSMPRVSDDAEWLSGYDDAPPPTPPFVGTRERGMSLDAILGGDDDDDDCDAILSGEAAPSSSAVRAVQFDNLGNASSSASLDDDGAPLTVAELEQELTGIRLKMHFMRDKVNQLEYANGGSLGPSSSRESSSSHLEEMDDGYVPFMG